MFVMEELFEPKNAFDRAGLDDARLNDEIVRSLVSVVLQLDLEVKRLQNRLNILEGRPE